MLQLDQDRREERFARNEAVFREIDEAYRELLDLYCECSDESCTVRIKVAVEHYEQVRAWPDRFLIYPRHDKARIERVVDRGRGYEVVEMFGDATRP